jgi:glycerol-3-phosphate acyltransferase PlsY
VIIAKLISVVILGYLLGSIPFGVLVGKFTTGTDIRKFGSGKMGATNVMRTAGRTAAALVAVLDLMKGVFAVVFAGLIIGKDYIVLGNHGYVLLLPAQVFAALAAVCGHNWPVFLKFKGGRGVATYFGGLVALCPVAALFGGEVLIIGAGLTRFASFGSIAGAVGAYTILVPLTIIDGFPWIILAYTLVGGIIIIVMHRDNIVRLFKGKERKLGEKVPVDDSHPHQ